MNYEKERQISEMYAVMNSGGVALFPVDVGYSLCGMTEEAAERIIELKKVTGKSLGILGTLKIARAVTVNRDYNRVHDLWETGKPFGAVVRLADDAPEIPAQVVRDRTVAIFLNTGEIADCVIRRSLVQPAIIFGSSANLSGAGNHYRLEDVEPEIRNGADYVSNFGPTRYQEFADGKGKAATLIDVVQGKIIREGFFAQELWQHAEQLGWLR